jgi:hypothetical protein
VRLVAGSRAGWPSLSLLSFYHREKPDGIAVLRWERKVGRDMAAPSRLVVSAVHDKEETDETRFPGVHLPQALLVTNAVTTKDTKASGLGGNEL